MTNGRISWKAAAFRPSDRKILTREGSRQSAQIAELQAVKLAVEQSIKEGQKHVHIFSDSWAVCNGIAIWSAKWRANSYTINNKPVWGQDAWLFLDQAPISIFVTHVDAHTNKTTFEAENNAIADRLAKVNIAIKLQNTARWRSTITEKCIKLKRDPNWQMTLPGTEAPVTPHEILEIHRFNGHMGTHAVFQWFQRWNIKVTWQACRKAIQTCPACPNWQQRFRHHKPNTIGKPQEFNHTVQIDYIGPLPSFKDQYACVIVDVCTGLGMATASRQANQISTIFALIRWCSAYGLPTIIESDQGSHFTGSSVQKWALDWDIMWNFHIAYNPTASGFVERFNGLLKAQLLQFEGEQLQCALNLACFQLNDRDRVQRHSPFQEAFLKLALPYPTPTDSTLLIPDKAIGRDRKNKALYTTDIVAQGPGHSF